MTMDGFARPRGWTLSLACSAVLIAGAVAIFAAYDAPIDGIRRVIRVTAHTSLAFFLPAFTASTLVQLWPNRLTRWIRAQRRQLGVTFAVSHIIHAIAIVALVRTDPSVFWHLSSIGNIAAGSVAYVAIILMLATSFEASARRLGPRLWTRLHTVGGWYIWLIFLVANGKRIPESANYALPAALLVIAAALKIFVKVRARRPARATPLKSSPAP